MKKKTYYIYWYRNPLKNGEIFYIGYGDYQRKCGGCRAYDHINEIKRGIISSNRHKYYTIKQILDSGKEPIVEIIFDGLTYSQAINAEVSLIEKHKSTLVNVTEGGDGGDTFTGQPTRKKSTIRKKLREKPPTIHSENWIQQLSENRRGQGNPFYGKRHSKKTKRMCGATWRGKKIPWELVMKRQRVSAYHVSLPEGLTVILRGRKEFEAYFKFRNEGKSKLERINWQKLLRVKSVGMFRIEKIEEIPLTAIKADIAM